MLDVNPIDPIEAYLIGKGDYEIYERRLFSLNIFLCVSDSYLQYFSVTGNGAEIFAVWKIAVDTLSQKRVEKFN